MARRYGVICTDICIPLISDQNRDGALSNRLDTKWKVDPELIEKTGRSAGVNSSVVPNVPKLPKNRSSRGSVSN